MSAMRKPISVLLPVRNCQEIIRTTLESIQWADEIFVVDTFSSDQTLDICKEYGAKIVQHEYINSAKQKNWAVVQCQHDWVLQIDSDETLEEGFFEELIEKLANVPDDVHCFRIPRKNHYLGKWMKFCGIYPDYQTRLFRKAEGRWIEREVHAHVVVSGRVETFTHHIIHQGMPTLSKQLANLDRYTRYEADELYKQGIRFKPIQILLRPWLTFIHRFFVLQGFRDGWRGFIYCGYLACYVFLMYAKLWEMKLLNLNHSPK